MVDPDRLAAAQWHHSHIDVVAAMPQILNDRLGYGALDPNLVAKGENPRGFDGLLRIKAAIQDPVHKMRVADRLVLAAHDAERHHRPPVFDQHRRDDRVKRSLLRRNHVRMPFDQGKLVPRLCSNTPLSGAMMPVPKEENSELMNDTALPSRS